MPTRRHPLKRRNVRDRRLTPQTVALFVLIEEIRNAGDDREWEPAGRHREYLDAEGELRRALGLLGHSVMPTDAGLAAGQPMPRYMENLSAGETWPKAVELRKQLLEAAARQADSDADLLPAFLAPTVASEK